MNEETTLQLGARQTLDDLTRLPVPTADVAWSVPGGGRLLISTTGLASAGAVGADTPATAQGIHAGNTATLPNATKI